MTASRFWRLEALVLIGFALLAAAQTRVFSDLGTRVYGGGRGDPGQDGWVLARVTHQLLHEPWRPFEGNLYFPSRDSVLYCDPLLGPALLALPVRLFSANPVLLYNAALLIGLGASSFGFYRLARRVGASRSAALLAGIAIPYGGQQAARFVHLNLLTLTFFPPLLLGLLDTLERPRLRAALLTGASFALQAATSGYHAFSAAILTGVSLLWGIRRLARPRTLAALAAAAVLAAVLLIPYLTGFLHLREHEARMSRDAAVPAALSLDLSYLFVSRAYLWRALLPGVHPFFPGLAVLAFAALSLRDLRRDRHVRLLVGLAAASFLLALGPEVRWRGEPILPGPFEAARRLVPLLDAMRHPFSLAVPGMIALGLLAALGLSRSSLARSPAAVAAVLAFSVAETLTEPPARSEAPSELPAVYSWLAQEAPGGILELPFDDGAWTWWAALHQLPIVNGVGAFEPARYQALWQLFRKEWKQASDKEGSRSLELLKTWYPIRYVVVHAEADAALRGSAEASSRSLRFLHETAEGDRVYLLVRRGEGSRLRRAFRDDQLGSGRIRVRLRGRPGLAVRARLNEEPLAGEALLAGGEVEHSFSLPRRLVRRGTNLIELRAGNEAERFELLGLATE